jgi:hypothetical protein
VSIHRRIDGPEDGARPNEVQEERRVARSEHLASGTLACPECDAPVAPIGAMSPADSIGCPLCDHAAPVRDFLSLAKPNRPARVEVRVVMRPALRRAAA